MPASFEIVSPVDGRVYATLGYASSQAVAAAASRARAAFRGWSQTPLSERIETVRRFAEAVAEQRSTLADDVAWQMGRPLQDADETGAFADAVERALELAPETLAERIVGADDNPRRVVLRGALGVHLAICAWNFPVAMVAGIVVPALVAGNTVLFKHAPQTALISERLNSAAKACGMPGGVFQALHMAHPDAETLLASGAVQSLQFIGSTEAGRAVRSRAAESLVQTVLELGGKDAAYVHADADVDRAAQRIAAGSLHNSGQSCCSVERIYVHADVYDRFVDCFVSAVEGWSLGHPVDSTPDLGPVVSETAAERINAQLAEAVAKGARPVFGSNRPRGAPDYPTYVPPQVLLHVDHSMNVMRQETFGPIAPVMKVQDDAEALALMDDTRYGLTASVWTGDDAVAEWFGRRLEVGTFYQNQCDHADPDLPWGGMRASGIGRTDGAAAFDGVTQYRSFYYNSLAS